MYSNRPRIYRKKVDSTPLSRREFSRGAIRRGEDKRETYNNDLIAATESNSQLQENWLVKKTTKVAGITSILRQIKVLPDTFKDWESTYSKFLWTFSKWNISDYHKWATGSLLTRNQNSANNILCCKSSKHPSTVAPAIQVLNQNAIYSFVYFLWIKLNSINRSF